jgi:hypothetical protein
LGFSEGRLVANAGNVFFATEDERRLARQSFWPFRCRERVVAFGTKDVAGSADAQMLRSALCFRNWLAANSSYF